MVDERDFDREKLVVIHNVRNAIEGAQGPCAATKLTERDGGRWRAAKTSAENTATPSSS